MKSKIRKILSRVYRGAEYSLKNCVIIFVRRLTYKSNSSMSVTFDSGQAVDGTGAQLQRMISVYALANYFGFHYVHSEIKQVSVHAFDPFQTEELYEKYLVEMNHFIQFNEISHTQQDSIVFTTYRVFFWKFMVLLVRNRFKNRPLYLALLDPYPITEFRSQIMDLIRSQIRLTTRDVPKYSHPTVVIHYRQGVGGFALYPGQNVPRETSLAQFERALLSVTNESGPKSIESIIVLTDAPTDVTFYRPPTHQQILWEGTPGYSNGVITIQPIDFGELSEKFDLPIHVIRGGNPLDAIYLMANSDYLLMGKSSLSYLGGIFNNIGEVYFPKNFWHRPLSKWRVF
jgi:hypothetical protein